MTTTLPFRRDQWAGVAALALAYWLAAVVSLRWAEIPGAGSAFWPAAGITLFALCRFGPQLWLGAVIGRLATFWTVPSDQPLLAEIAIAFGTALAGLLPVLALRPLRIDSRLQSLRSALWLVGLAAIGGATISAAIGGLSLRLGGTPPTGVAKAFTSWWFGYVTGVLTFAPLLLSLSSLRRLSMRRWLQLAAICAAAALLAYVIFLRPDLEPKRAWFMFPALVWGALAFNVPGAALVCLITSAFAFLAAVLGVGTFAQFAPDNPILLTQQFVAVMSGTTLLLAAVADERRGRDALAASETRLRAASEALAILNSTGAAIAAELDLDRAVQVVTDAGVAVTGARFGAFFYNAQDDGEGGYMLFALSGAPREAFADFGHPRPTAIFAPTFEGFATVRSDDITRDRRYGRQGPHFGMPKGHPPVRSYLAVPVRSRSGEVIGGLIFGHPDPGVFGERAEWLADGVAAHAAIAVDNARLYQSAQRELAQRRKAEEHQALLINELNHRVKNTLATVQSLGVQTLRGSGDLTEVRHAFEGRLIALSAAHNLLTASSWESAELAKVVQQAIAPFGAERFDCEGPAVRLTPSQALALAMAFHELGTNAIKYGALSAADGRVAITWTAPAGMVELRWIESGGPEVTPSERKGFGSRLIKEGLARELGGEVRLLFERDGVCCEIRFSSAAPGTPPKFKRVERVDAAKPRTGSPEAL